MQTYTFDERTGEFLRAEPAFLDPLESRAQGRKVYLLPASSTFTPPPAPREGFARLWNGKAWEQVEDHRQKQNEHGEIIEDSGTAYWIPGDTWDSPARHMAKPGPLPEGAMLKAPAKPAEVLAAEALALAKAERARAVAALTVEVDGLTFDGDEPAQERMSRTITAATATGAGMEAATTWVLHDSSVAQVTIRQLATALRKAGEAQTALWGKPYTG